MWKQWYKGFWKAREVCFQIISEKSSQRWHLNKDLKTIREQTFRYLSEKPFRQIQKLQRP